MNQLPELLFAVVNDVKDRDVYLEALTHKVLGLMAKVRSHA